MKKKHLEIIDLYHRYGSVDSEDYTLKSINLQLEQGELVGLVGPSGCGKTTLLRLIAGFESPNQGIILLSGNQISSNRSILPPEKRGIGMVFQDYALFPHLNVLKNVCFGLPRKSDLSRTYWLLELLGLNKFVSRFPHELSGGQKQRLALARALSPGNSLVLLDEPFNSLDVQVKMRLRTELSAVLKAFSATGILVTHDSQEALSICDRVAVMNTGQLHQCDTADQLINHPRTSFVGEFLFQKNILPVKHNEKFLSTPLGPLEFSNINGLSNIQSIMFDSNALKLELSDRHNSIIKSREYHHDHWIFTVKFNDYYLRVMHPICDSICIGQSCFVSFKSNQRVLLFPGSISTVVNHSVST